METLVMTNAARSTVVSLVRAVLLTSLFFAAGPAGASDAPRVEKILWIGSSSTYWNYMGKQIGDRLTADSGGDARYIAHLVWRNGTRIETFLEAKPEGGPVLGLDRGQTTLERIRDGEYKFVVLQVVTHFMSDPKWGPPQDGAIDVYVRAIRAAGGEPVIYEQSWRNDLTKTPEDHRNGRLATLAAAARNNVELVAPCATAWDLVREERPDLPLQEPRDLAHPGPLGNFLNCCVFQATLTREKPRETPRSLVAWDHHWRDGYKADVIPPQVTVAPPGDTWRSDPSWKAYIGPYPDKIRGYVGTIDEPTAAYLEDAAWRACRDYRLQLKAATERANAAPGR